VVVNLAISQASGQGIDRLYGIENIIGSSHDDRLIGNLAANALTGGNGDDWFFGEHGTDRLDGGNGNDTLLGGDDNDALNGGTDRDVLSGGTGSDTLDGGSGADVFSFPLNTSGTTASTADVIIDWSVGIDRLDTAVSGTLSNYHEAATSATSIEDAAIAGESLLASSSLRHMFLYNTGTNTGYLLSDLDGNTVLDSGIIVRQAGSAAAMNYLDII
jgi:Ca2+-binding RTX toxin-like protein